MRIYFGVIYAIRHCQTTCLSILFSFGLPGQLELKQLLIDLLCLLLGLVGVEGRRVLEEQRKKSDGAVQLVLLLANSKIFSDFVL